MKNNDLDKYYTNPIISDELVNLFLQIFRGYEIKSFLEPSAGSGNFIHSLIKSGVPQSHIEAYDLEPTDHTKIQTADFLNLNLPYRKGRVAIGNPPFGKRGKLAIAFLNKCLEISDIVAFIVPLTFRRYSVHKQIEANARLIYEIALPKNSFIVNGKEYAVNCVFQIWIRPNVAVYAPDFRKRIPPKNKIPEITTYIHNNTKSTLKYFDRDKYHWDFAVVRQGYYDYSEKITDPTKLKVNRQYLFIKINDPKIKPYLDKIDFDKLANSNTTIRGFSNTDLIEALNNLRGINH